MRYVKEGEITRIMPDKRQRVMAVESKKVADSIQGGIKINNHGLTHDCSGYESNFTKEDDKVDILVFVELDKLKDKTYLAAINKMGLRRDNIYAVDVVVNDYQIYTVNKGDLGVNSELKCSLWDCPKSNFSLNVS